MMRALCSLNKHAQARNRVTQAGATNLCHVGHSGVGLGQAVKEPTCCFQQGTGCVDIVVSKVVKQGLHRQSSG